MQLLQYLNGYLPLGENKVVFKHKKNMRECKKDKAISKEGYKWCVSTRSAKSRRWNKRRLRKRKRQKYKEEIAEIMRSDGASDDFIFEVITNAVIKVAIENDLSPAEMAWSLIQ